MLQSPRMGWISQRFTLVVRRIHFIRILFRKLRLILAIFSIKTTYILPVLMYNCLAVVKQPYRKVPLHFAFSKIRGKAREGHNERRTTREVSISKIQAQPSRTNNHTLSKARCLRIILSCLNCLGLLL